MLNQTGKVLFNRHWRRPLSMYVYIRENKDYLLVDGVIKITSISYEWERVPTNYKISPPTPSPNEESTSKTKKVDFPISKYKIGGDEVYQINNFGAKLFIHECVRTDLHV